jgi:hypothetical protein
MLELKELRKEVGGLRKEVEAWKAIAVYQEGKIGRAQGTAEGVAEMAKLLLDALDRRVTALEQLRQAPQPVLHPAGQTWTTWKPEITCTTGSSPERTS